MSDYYTRCAVCLGTVPALSTSQCPHYQGAITAAPTMRPLATEEQYLAEIASLKAQLAESQSAHRDEASRAVYEMTRLEGQLDEAMRGLEFYASNDKYPDEDACSDDLNCLIIADRGRIARECLERLGK